MMSIQASVDLREWITTGKPNSAAQPTCVDKHAVHDDAVGDAGRQWRILRQVRREDLVDICALFVVHAEIKHPLGTRRA